MQRYGQKKTPKWEPLEPLLKLNNVNNNLPMEKSFLHLRLFNVWLGLKGGLRQKIFKEGKSQKEGDLIIILKRGYLLKKVGPLLKGVGAETSYELWSLLYTCGALTSCKKNWKSNKQSRYLNTDQGRTDHRQGQLLRTPSRKPGSKIIFGRKWFLNIKTLKLTIYA